MRSRDFILTAMAVLTWFALPVAATAEQPALQAVRVCRTTALPEFKRADFSKAPEEPPQFEECWYQDPEQAALGTPGTIGIRPGAEVDPALAWRNRIRARSDSGFLRARAFPWSVRFGHGFRGRRSYRGHGRRW
jgi:hypothetical protein